jgi:LacI family transcriptional regulator, repressor for deo operon, udp, cdd, tsx, nupC, and nupG
MLAVANIYDVARRAGVSTATVSRVFSQPDVVAAATRRKVLAISDRLDFTPNVAFDVSRRAAKIAKDLWDHDLCVHCGFA